MATNPTAGYINCKCCNSKMALKKTTQGNLSGDCDGCGFRHYFPIDTPSHREAQRTMTPYVDPFAKPEADPKPTPAKSKAAPAPSGLLLGA